MTLGRIDYLNPLNDRHPLATGLVSFWLPLPNMGGGAKLFDLCGRRYDGTLTNGPTWVPGQNGFGALSFDGTDDYVNCNNVSIGGLPQLTVAVAVRATDITGGGANLRYPASKEGPGGNTTSFMHRLSTTGGVYQFYVGTSDYKVAQTGGGAAAVGRWDVLIGTYDGSQVRLYHFPGNAGGTRYDGDTTSGVIGTNTNGLWVGDYSAGTGRCWAGGVGAVAVSAVAWGDAAAVAWNDEFRRGFPDLLRRVPERAAYYSATSPPPPPPPAGAFVPLVAGLGW